MASGIVGVLAGSGTLTYTPATNAKVFLQISGTAGATVNGFQIAGSPMMIFVGSGQTLNIAAGGSSVIVSSVEES